MRWFLAACNEHPLEFVFVVLGATGMRIGEALGLRWKHVDLDTRTVRIEQILYRMPVVARKEEGDTFALGEPKTEKSRRTLVLPAAAVAVLKVVQEVRGHSQMSITSDTYSHVLPELPREAADRLGDVLFGGSARSWPPDAPLVITTRSESSVFPTDS